MKKQFVASLLLAAQMLPFGAFAQEEANPWADVLSSIRSSSTQVKELRTLIKRPRRLRCSKLETYQINSLIRWIHNSGKFQYDSFSMIKDRLPYYEYNPDEVIRLLGEEGEDQETDQLDENKPLDPTAPTNEEGFSADEIAEIEESKVEMFATPDTIKFIDEMAVRNYETIRQKLSATPTMTVTALTTSPKHNNDVHCSHMTGYAFDLRPLPGIQPRTFWWVKNKRIYDSRMNQILILDLIKQPQVKTIIFNDPVLHRDKEIKEAIAERLANGNPVKFLRLLTPTYSGGKKYPNTHHYHIHVELGVEEPMVQFTRDLLKAVKPVSVARRRPRPKAPMTPIATPAPPTPQVASTSPGPKGE